MPKIEYDRISAIGGEILEKVFIFVPARLPATKSKKGILRGDKSKLILPRVKPTAKQRSVLEEDKYTPGSGPRWKQVNARFLALYKALLAEPDPATCSAMLRSVPRASR